MMQTASIESGKILAILQSDLICMLSASTSSQIAPYTISEIRVPTSLEVTSTLDAGKENIVETGITLALMNSTAVAGCDWCCICEVDLPIIKSQRGLPCSCTAQPLFLDLVTRAASSYFSPPHIDGCLRIYALHTAHVFIEADSSAFKLR